MADDVVEKALPADPLLEIGATGLEQRLPLEQLLSRSLTGEHADASLLQHPLGLDPGQGVVRQLESSLDQVAQNDARFRSIAGLDPIDPEVLQVGVGGPGLGTPDEYPLWDVDSTAATSAFAAGTAASAIRTSVSSTEPFPAHCLSSWDTRLPAWSKRWEKVSRIWHQAITSF